MAKQDTENLTKELKGQMPIPQTVRKVNGTVSTLTYNVQMKRNRTTFPVVKFQASPLTQWLIAQGYVTMFEAHRMGLYSRV